MVLLCAALVLGMFSGVAGAQAETVDGGITNVTGLPIVNEPITLTAYVVSSAIRPDMDKTTVLDYIEEHTGIRLDVTIISDTEKMSLMFASQEFPDILMYTGLSEEQLQIAANGGSLMPLDDLINDYAPNWKAFFETDAIANSLMRYPDGYLYGLPYVDYDSVERDLRDQWCINQAWLTELGLQYPTTVEEFRDVLRAFKAAAGTGTIPENVIPYYVRFDQWIMGQFDLYGCFGVYASDANMMSVIDGQVVYQGVNPAIKSALQYMRELYAEGLLTPEMFTDDSTTYRSITSSKEPMVGSFSIFNNTVPDKFTALAPLTSEQCDTPYMRRQLRLQTAKNFMITSECEHPEAAIRLADWIASSDDITFTIAWGQQGTFWDYGEDGKIYKIIDANEPAYTEKSADFGYHNSFIAMRDDAFYSNYYDRFVEVENSRSWAFYNVYKDYIAPAEMLYVGAPLDADGESRLMELANDLNTYRTKTFANWISGNGDIEAEWDNYVATCEQYGLSEYLDLRTQAYSAIYGE
jgi:putative aldouronate transport system substrate-binding protein